MDLAKEWKGGRMAFLASLATILALLGSGAVSIVQFFQKEGVKLPSLDPWLLLMAASAITLLGIRSYKHHKERKSWEAGVVPTDAEREEVVGRTFIGERVDIDGRRFVNCIFKGCNFHFRGVWPPHFIGCRFEDPRWVFSGPAGMTWNFMEAMHGLNPSMVEGWMNQIRGESSTKVVAKDEAD